MDFFIDSVLTPLFFILFITLLSAFISSFCGIYQEKKGEKVTFMMLPEFMQNVWKGLKTFLSTVFLWKKLP